MKKLIFLIVSITSLILIAGHHSAMSQQNKQDIDPEYFYYSDHKKIPLAPSSDLVALRFKPGGKYHISICGGIAKRNVTKLWKKKHLCLVIL